MRRKKVTKEDIQLFLDSKEKLEKTLEQINSFAANYLETKKFNEEYSNIMSNINEIDSKFTNKLNEDFHNYIQELYLKNQEYIKSTGNKLIELQSQYSNELSNLNSLINNIKETLNENKSKFELIDTKNNDFQNMIINYDEKISEVVSNQSIIDKKNNEIKSSIEDLSLLIESLQLEIKKFNYLEESYQKIAKEEIKKVLTSEETTQMLAKSAGDLILKSFNESLVDFKKKEQKTIIQAIKEILDRKISNQIVYEDENKIEELEQDEVFHQQYNQLKNYVLAGVIPMLVGPAGSGKSHAITQLAKDLKLNFYMANRIQNTFELLGFVDASGKYVTTQFYEAYTKGGIFFFDEVDASSPEALVTINAAIAQGKMAFPGHPTNIVMNKNLKIVVAGNTYGKGATIQYSGRNPLDAATLDRFAVIDWNYDEKLEDKKIQNKELLNLCWALRKNVKKISSINDSKIIISTRSIITLEKILNQEEKNPTNSLSVIFKNKFFPDLSYDKFESFFNKLKEEKDIEKNKYFGYIKEIYKIYGNN